MSKPCDQFEPLLTRYVLGDLDAATYTRVRDHVSSCRHCRAVLRDLQPTLGLLQSALAVPPKVSERLSPDRRDRILDQARRKPLWPWPTIPWPGIPLVAVAAALLVVCLVAGFLLHSKATRYPRPASADLSVPLLPLPAPGASSLYASAKASVASKQVTLISVKPADLPARTKQPAGADRLAKIEVKAPAPLQPVVNLTTSPVSLPAAGDGLARTEMPDRNAARVEVADTRAATYEPVLLVDAKSAIDKRTAEETFRLSPDSGKVKKDAQAKAAATSAAVSGQAGVDKSRATGGRIEKDRLASAKPATPSSPVQIASSAAAAKAGSAAAGVAGTVPAWISVQGDGQEPVSADSGFKRPDVAPFIRTHENAISPFAVNVDTTAYVTARADLLRGKLPPANTVRTEAFINTFDYGYKPPEKGTFALAAECAPSPFRHGLYLLKIGISTRSAARDGSRPWPQVVAAGIDSRVEFNPLGVKRYRRLGYENPRSPREASRTGPGQDGAIMTAGQSVTVLYEIELCQPIKESVGTIRLHYRDAQSGRIEDLAQPIAAATVLARFKDSGMPFRLAAAAAEFAEFLRGSPFTGGNNTDNIARVLQPVAREMKNDARVQELLRFIQDAKTMPRSP